MSSPLYRTLLVFVLLLVGFSGVRIADPALGHSPPRIDENDPPQEQVADAIRRTAHRDHTVIGRVISLNDTAIVGRNTFRFDHSDQRYLMVLRDVGPNGSEGAVAAFRTQGMGWVTTPYGEGAPWLPNQHARYRGQETVLAPDAITAAEVTVVAENASVLVIHIEDDEAAREIFRPLASDSEVQATSNVTIYVNRSSETVSRIVRYVGFGEVWYRWEYELTKFGQTTVTRPKGVPAFSLRELLGDIYYG